MNGAHIDSPRLDLKPNPLFEKDEIAYLKPHYYGGIRKYQWGTVPLSMHGVVVKADGEVVEISIGENEGDPQFCVTDLLPHLASEQNGRKLAEGLKGEELNIIIGSIPYHDEENEKIKNPAKLLAMKLLNERYGITEKISPVRRSRWSRHTRRSILDLTADLWDLTARMTASARTQL